MPTLSNEEIKRRTDECSDVVLKMITEGFSYRGIAQYYGVNHEAVITLAKDFILRPQLWNAMLARGDVRKQPRRQKHFMVPIDNIDAAREKIAAWYPDAQVMTEWETYEL